MMGADFFKFGGDLCLNLVVAVKWVDEDVVRPSVTITTMVGRLRLIGGMFRGLLRGCIRFVMEGIGSDAQG